mmetsp:Transcript_30475/g.61797  ORF Transcript_30475/g.61797 Transcript_30475/m.61797 type:complete len:90 (-) Transcript_30475:2982-3251(-)
MLTCARTLNDLYYFFKLDWGHSSRFYYPSHYIVALVVSGSLTLPWLIYGFEINKTPSVSSRPTNWRSTHYAAVKPTVRLLCRGPNAKKK